MTDKPRQYKINFGVNICQSNGNIFAPEKSRAKDLKQQKLKENEYIK